MNGDHCEGWKWDNEKKKTQNKQANIKQQFSNYKKKNNRAKLNRIERRRGVRENIRGKAKINK